jgi:hypothetical protein
MNASLRPIVFVAVATLLVACGQNQPSAKAARQQLVAATTQAKQAESDRLSATRLEGSVSTSDDEHAQGGLRLPRFRRLPGPERARLAVRIGSDASNTQLLLDSTQFCKAFGGGWQVFEPNKESSS